MMKIGKSILFFICITLTYSTIIHAQTDTTLKKLLLINYNTYKGHSVDSLVKILPSGSIKMIVTAGHRVDYGDQLLIEYSNNVVVAIDVVTFKYMNPLINKTNSSLPPTVNWKIDLFKKETIAYTMVYQGVNCYVGCEHDPRYYK